MGLAMEVFQSWSPMDDFIGAVDFNGENALRAAVIEIMVRSTSNGEMVDALEYLAICYGNWRSSIAYESGER